MEEFKLVVFVGSVCLISKKEESGWSQHGNLLRVQIYGISAEFSTFAQMRKPMKYVLCVILMLVAIEAAGQDVRFDEHLDRYEDLCGQCMDIKSRAESGENVSRSMVKSLIDSFLVQNRTLKQQEADMTAAQRYRFKEISRWFVTGERPDTICSVPPVHTELPYVPVAMLQSAYCGITPVSDTVFCVNSVSHFDLRRGTDVPCGKPRGDVFILASIAAPDMAYGLMAGYKHKRLGGYLAFRSSFNSCNTLYTCASDGSMKNGSKIWPTGNEKRSNLSVTGGLLVGTTKWLTAYAGIGYGFRKLAWEDVGGKWALVSDWSRSGFAAEVGLIASWRYLAISAGVSTISFRTAAFTCGVGVRF